MKTATKIGIGLGIAALVGGGIYLATREPAKPKKTKRTPSVSARPMGPKIGLGQVDLGTIWSESVKARLQPIAQQLWKEQGEPAWSPNANLALARALALEAFPGTEWSQNDSWPSTIEESDAWIRESSKSRPQPGARLWRNLWYLSSETLGYVPVT